MLTDRICAWRFCEAIFNIKMKEEDLTEQIMDWLPYNNRDY